MIYLASAILIALAAWSITDARRANARLDGLRKTAWLRDERGHLRRYADCSAAVRAKAESN